jgi:ribosomal protein S18 acetylase RimI-like enzyme
MVSLPHPTLVRHDGPRLMHPLLDGSGVAQLMRVAFQSEVSSGSLPILPDWFWLRWLQPVLGFFEWLGMETPEQMLGYVWEERGHIVGNVTLGLTQEHSRAWLLSNVAVHPSCRRRGIARALIELAIRETRRHGGRYLALQVQSDNVAARTLYESLGFCTLERVSEFYGAHVQVAAPVTSAFALTRPTREQWSQLQERLAAQLPRALRGCRHTLAGAFQPGPQRGLAASLGDLARGVQHAHWCVTAGMALFGGMLVQAQLGWGAHRVGVYVAPEAQGQVERALLAQAMLWLRGFPSQRVTFSLAAEHEAMQAELRRAGMREVRALELMGLELQGDD